MAGIRYHCLPLLGPLPGPPVLSDLLLLAPAAPLMPFLVYLATRGVHLFVISPNQMLLLTLPWSPQT